MSEREGEKKRREKENLIEGLPSDRRRSPTIWRRKEKDRSMPSPSLLSARPRYSYHSSVFLIVSFSFFFFNQSHLLLYQTLTLFLLILRTYDTRLTGMFYVAAFPSFRHNVDEVQLTIQRKTCVVEN